MLLFTFVSGIVPATLLMVFRSWKHRPSLFLAFLLLSLSLYSFYWNEQFWPFLQPGSTTRMLAGSAILLAGPALYGYVRALEQQNTRFYRFWPHLLPFLLFLILELPFGPEKGIHTPMLPAAWLNPGGYLLAGLQELAQRNLQLVCGPLLFLGYVLWSCNQSWAQETTVPGKTISWPILWQGLLCLFAVITFALAFLSGFSRQLIVTTQMAGLLPYIFNISFSAIAISVFYFPEILYGAILLPEKQEVHSPNGPSKTRRVNMEQEYLHEMQDIIESCMEKEKVFLDPNLNLTRFSVITDIPVHHLTFYFRTEKKLSFSEYRNFWRVQHAKNMIAEGYACYITLEAIGEKSGFSSRNAFLSAFKRFEGVAPREFLQQYLVPQEQLVISQPARFNK